MVFLNSFQNPLNQKRIAIITFQDYDFLKNHDFPGYAGGLVKLPHPYPGNFSFSSEKQLPIPTQNSPIHLKTIVSSFL